MSESLILSHTEALTSKITKGAGFGWSRRERVKEERWAEWSS